MKNLLILKDVAYASKRNTALTPTGTTATGSKVITAVSSTVGLLIGEMITGTGIPTGSFITALTATTITISKAATANGVGITITAAVLITGVNELNLLQEGSLAMFDENNALIAIGSSYTPTTDKHYFAVGRKTSLPDGGAKLTVLFDRKTSKYNKKAYVAPVSYEMQVGYDATATAGSLGLPTTLVEGTTVALRIIDDSRGTLPPKEVKRYEEVVTIADTVDTLITRLVARINNDPYGFVTASVTGTGVTLGIHLVAELGVHIQVGTDGLIRGATLYQNGVASSTSVALNLGSGTPSELLELEQEASVEEGDTNKVWLRDKYFTVPSAVDSTETYDLYDIETVNKKKNPIGEDVATRSVLIVALPNGATIQTNFDNRLAQIFA